MLHGSLELHVDDWENWYGALFDDIHQPDLHPVHLGADVHQSHLETLDRVGLIADQGALQPLQIIGTVYADNTDLPPSQRLGIIYAEKSG